MYYMYIYYINIYCMYYTPLKNHIQTLSILSVVSVFSIPTIWTNTSWVVTWVGY